MINVKDFTDTLCFKRELTPEMLSIITNTISDNLEVVYKKGLESIACIFLKDSFFIKEWLISNSLISENLFEHNSFSLNYFKNELDRVNSLEELVLYYNNLDNLSLTYNPSTELFYL